MEPNSRTISTPKSFLPWVAFDCRIFPQHHEVTPTHRNMGRVPSQLCLSMFILSALCGSTETPPLSHPTPGLRTVLCFRSTHSWILWPPDLEIGYTAYYQMLVQIHGKPHSYLPLLIHSPLGMKGKQWIHFTKIITFTYFYHELKEWF